MTYYSDAPVMFKGISHVTATLFGHQEGDRINYAGCEYVYAYNAANSDIVPTTLVQANSAATGYSITNTNTTNTGIPIGMVVHATLTTGTYGWIMTRGFCTVEMTANSGTVAARGALTVGVNGTAAPVIVQTALTTTDGATIEPLFPVGYAVEAIVSSASGSAYISCF